jgi:uncharacterized membrane protein
MITRAAPGRWPPANLIPLSGPLARNPKAKPMSLWFLLLCAFMLMAYAAIGGIFLAFSDFIMRSFDLVRNQAGIETMQVLNVEIMRSIFMVLFMGLAILSLVIMVYAALNLDGTSRSLLLLAGISYVVGVFAVTAAGNVPLNNQLAALAPATSQALAFWKETYMTRWVALNSLRTLACFLASGSTLAALIIR